MDKTLRMSNMETNVHTIGGLTQVYYMEDRGTRIRLWYFLPTGAPTLDDFLSLQERQRRKGKVFAGNPIAARWASGISTWATEALGRAQATIPQINRGRWQYIARLDLVTDGRMMRIERTGGNMGHFTVFADPPLLLESIREIKHL